MTEDLFECIVEDINRGSIKYRWDKGDFNYLVIRRTGETVGRPGVPRPGIQRRTNRLTTEKVIELRSRSAAGESYASLGRSYGISLNQARLVAIGKRWGWVS